MDDVIGQAQWDRISAGARRQCVAKSRSGERCRRAPIVGGFVCVMHGGKNPVVQQSARERLLSMVEPALDALMRFLRTAPPCEACGRSDADRDPVVLRAAQVVLDRTGYHPTLSVEVAAPNPFEHMSEDELIARLEVVLASAKQDRDRNRAYLLPASRLQVVSVQPIQVAAVRDTSGNEPAPEV